MTDNGIRLAVVGVSGAGKTAFVRTVVEAAGLTQQQATGYPGNPLKSSDDGDSCTKTIMKAQVKVDGIVVQLWDTPGFDDSGHKDALIFHEIVKKMCDAESKGYGINGVILLEPVIEPRVKGSDRSRIKMLMETIGSNAFGRVAVVGTKWDKVNQATAEKGEGNRSNGVWKELIDEGARVFRFDGKQAAALQIVRHFVTNRQGFAPFTPQVVAQLQNNSGNLAQTSAYTALDGTLAQREHGAREESKLLGGDKELEEMASNISAARKWLKKQIITVWKVFVVGVTVLSGIDLCGGCPIQ